MLFSNPLIEITFIAYYWFSYFEIHIFCRFGSGQLDAARSAARKFIDQESAKIAEPFSRQPKVQEIETNEIPQQNIVPVLPNAYIPSFTGTYGPRSPFWLRRF